MDKLNILWTTDNEKTVSNMLMMYAYNAKTKRWFDEVNVIIWGASSLLVAESEKVQHKVAELIGAGVKVEACKACADDYGVSDKLKSLGIGVRYMGMDLTEILKTDAKLLTL